MIACTIAIPVYNRAELIRAALDSALGQLAPDLEILVVDNASTDGTWDVLQSYHDPRLRLVRNDANVGLYGNLNRCLELARGKYLRILCSDDRLMPGCIAVEIQIMERHPQVAMLSTRGREINAEGCLQRIFAQEFPPGLYAGMPMIGNVLWMVAHYNSNPLNYPSGILLRLSTAQQAGEFTDKYRLVGDIDYWLRLMTRGDVIVADHVGCEVMVHDSQAGLSVMHDGLIAEEFYALAEQWREHLQQCGLERQVFRQIAGFAAYTALRMRLKEKRLETARLYWRSARQPGFSNLTLLMATGRFAWMAQARKRRHAQLPPATARPL